VIFDPQHARPQAVEGQVTRIVLASALRSSRCMSDGLTNASAGQPPQTMRRFAGSTDTAAQFVCFETAQTSTISRRVWGTPLGVSSLCTRPRATAGSSSGTDSGVVDCWPWVASVRPLRATAIDVRFRLVEG
jgi:hypothetical protein